MKKFSFLLLTMVASCLVSLSSFAVEQQTHVPVVHLKAVFSANNSSLNKGKDLPTFEFTAFNCSKIPFYVGNENKNEEQPVEAVHFKACVKQNNTIGVYFTVHQKVIERSLKLLQSKETDPVTGAILLKSHETDKIDLGDIQMKIEADIQ